MSRANDPSPDGRLLTLREVSERTGMSIDSLRRDIRLRRLAVIRRSKRGRIYVAEEDLKAFLNRLRRAAVGEL